MEPAHTSLTEYTHERFKRLEHQIRRVLATGGVRKARDRLRRVFQLTLTEGGVPPIFVYQMGKVGSKSIEESLAAHWPAPVLHGHAVRCSRLLYPDVSALYWSHLAREARPLYVVSLVREPISRNVSHHFQINRDNEHVLNRDIAFLGKHFLAHCNHSLALRWFDKFFRPQVGVDVYGKPFPPEGYATYKRGSRRVLVLRVEMPDDEKEAILARFLGLEDFSISTTNVTGDKWFAEKYARFKEHFRPPAWYVDMMHDTKYTAHFYGDEKGKRLRSRWAKKATQTSEREPWI